MKKKKKTKSNNIHDILFDYYSNIIKFNNQNNQILNNMNTIKQHIDNFNYNDIKEKNNNFDFINDFINIDYTYYKFSKEDKTICSKICKYSYIYKNTLIPNFNIKKNIIKQLNYFFIKYENFIIKFYRDKYNYNVNLDGILDYNDLFILVKDAKCIPFWNDKCEELSKQIFIPIDSNMIKSNKPNIFNYNNWFNTEHKIIKNNNINSKNLEINKERNFVKQYKNKKTGQIENIIKSHKIKIYFNSKQKTFIKRLFGVYRYFYNRTINYINNYNKNTNNTFYLIDCKNVKSKINIDLSNEKNKLTFITIRKLIKKNYPEWIDKINFPSHLIDMAIKEAVSSYNGCMVKFNKYKIPFSLKLKSKKDKIQTMNIEKLMINLITNSLFYNLKDYDSNDYVFRNLKTSCKFNKYSNICDSSIGWNQKINEFYINLNFEDLKLINKNILKNKKICSIDPGLKTFLTIYSDNSVNKIGINIRDKIEKLCKEIDIIISEQYIKKGNKFKNNYQKRKSLKKALHLKIKYLENLKNELHNKSISFLCSNYGKIIIPPFETQKMVSNKKLNSKTSRNLMCVSYYKFLSKLKVKCFEYDIELLIRPEYYTSKTCSKCGNLKHNLKNEDIYNCIQCGLKIDRDTNGARNIMLRNLIN